MVNKLFIFCAQIYFNSIFAIDNFVLALPDVVQSQNSWQVAAVKQSSRATDTLCNVSNKLRYLVVIVPFNNFYSNL